MLPLSNQLLNPNLTFGRFGGPPAVFDPENVLTESGVALRFFMPGVGAPVTMRDHSVPFLAEPTIEGTSRRGTYRGETIFFDGASSLDFGNQPRFWTGTNNFAVWAWVMPTDDQVGIRMLFGKYTPSEPQFFFEVNGAEPNLAWWGATSGFTQANAGSGENLTANRWNFVFMQGDVANNTVDLWIGLDGGKATKRTVNYVIQTAAGGMRNASSSFQVGALVDPVRYFFTGCIGLCGMLDLHSSLLTDAQVNVLAYNPHALLRPPHDWLLRGPTIVDLLSSLFQFTPQSPLLKAGQTVSPSIFLFTPQSPQLKAQDILTAPEFKFTPQSPGSGAQQQVTAPAFLFTPQTPQAKVQAPLTVPEFKFSTQSSSSSSGQVVTTPEFKFQAADTAPSPKAKIIIATESTIFRFMGGQSISVSGVLDFITAKFTGFIVNLTRHMRRP